MKYTGHIALIFSLSITIYLIADYCTGKAGAKTAVVQMDQLVYEFKGMKEASSDYGRKLDIWKRESDSLEQQLRGLYQQLREDSIRQDHRRLRQDLARFALLRRSYAEHAQNSQQHAEEKDREMTLGVINQLNEHIKNYAELQGYTVVLCNNGQQPSVGYAAGQADITKEVLAYANARYEGGK
jgi:Skp family chaperone for outer membrane proteins